MAINLPALNVNAVQLATFPLNVAPSTGAFLVGYTTATAGGEIRVPLVSVLSGFHLNPTLQGYTQTASATVPSTSMAANAVDVLKPINTFVASGGPILTFSNLAPTAGTVTTIEMTAVSGDAYVVTPTGYSFNRGGNITGFKVPNNTTSSTTWRYNGARWDVRGDPVLSDGLGAYQLQTSAAALATDLSYSGPIRTGTLGQMTTVGSICTLYHNTKWYKTASDIARGTSGDARRLLGICVTSGNDGQSSTFLRPGGVVRNDSFGFTGLAGPGTPLWITSVTGGMATGVPTAANAVLRCVGFVRFDNEVEFNPDIGISTNAAS